MKKMQITLHVIHFLKIFTNSIVTNIANEIFSFINLQEKCYNFRNEQPRMKEKYKCLILHFKVLKYIAFPPLFC